MKSSASDKNTGYELRRIVRINEEIKSVVATAFKINLMAMNAIFLAKRAGQAALGFGVLSNELRRFATDLQAQMTALRQMTYGSVGTVNALVKQARFSRILERTREQTSGKGRDILDLVVRGPHAVELEDKRSRLNVVNRRLQQMLADTTQLVELGSVLARSAKIEAAYSGGFSASLTQVSSDFENTISLIQQSLERLNKNHREDQG
jgi:methyl-accepting chemotaxis protein